MVWFRKKKGGIKSSRAHRRGPLEPPLHHPTVRSRHGPEAAVGQGAVLQGPPVADHRLRLLDETEPKQRRVTDRKIRSASTCRETVLSVPSGLVQESAGFSRRVLTNATSTVATTYGGQAKRGWWTGDARTLSFVAASKQTESRSYRIEECTVLMRGDFSADPWLLENIH